jgi:hypothetical protein
MIQIKAGKHVGDITEHSTGPVHNHNLLGSLIQHSSEEGSVNASTGRDSA